MGTKFIPAILLFYLIGNSLFGFEITYQLKVIDPIHHLTQIRLQFENFKNKEVRLEFSPGSFNETRSLKVGNFKAYDSKGEPLVYENQNNTFFIRNENHHVFFIEYQLVMNQFQNVVFKGPIGKLTEKYLLSKAGWTFLMPLDQPPDAVFIDFRLPPEWQPITPWQTHDSGFSESNFQRFIHSTYAAGRFKVIQKIIQGTKVKIAVDMNFIPEFRDKIFNNCYQIFSFLKSRFKAELPKQHLSVIIKPTGKNEWQYINESGESHGEVASNLNDIRFQFQHRVFHTFNAFIPAGMNIESGWFLEGVNEYYYVRSLIHLKDRFPFKKLEHLYKNIYLNEKSRWDKPLSGLLYSSGGQSYFLNYQKGALIAYLLDREIRLKTSNLKSMDDLLASLYKNYGQHQNGIITDQVIQKTVSDLTHTDFNSFFKEMVYGETVLEMSPLFSDQDQDSLPKGLEELLGTNPLKIDSDNDGASDHIEYLKGTDPISAFSKPKDLFFIDGLDQDWKKSGANLIPLQSKNKKCDIELKEARFKIVDNIFYFQIATKCPILKNKKLRYYLNIDLDSKMPAEYNFAALYQNSGDSSKFNKDWTTHDFKRMDEVENLESAVANVVEFKIPLAFMNHTGPFRATFGLWDTTTNKALTSTHWLNFP